MIESWPARTLVALRDTLLPKLLSGQIRVGVGGVDQVDEVERGGLDG